MITQFFAQGRRITGAGQGDDLSLLLSPARPHEGGPGNSVYVTRRIAQVTLRSTGGGGGDLVMSFKYIPWCERAVNLDTVVAGGAVISSKFSGCHLIKYREDGMTRACHFHMDAQDPFFRDDLYWSFRNGPNREIVRDFAPAQAATRAYANGAAPQRGDTCLGLITGDNRCYAITGRHVGFGTANFHYMVAGAHFFDADGVLQ